MRLLSIECLSCPSGIWGLAASTPEGTRPCGGGLRAPTHRDPSLPQILWSSGLGTTQAGGGLQRSGRPNPVGCGPGHANGDVPGSSLMPVHQRSQLAEPDCTFGVRSCQASHTHSFPKKLGVPGAQRARRLGHRRGDLNRVCPAQACLSRCAQLHGCRVPGGAAPRESCRDASSPAAMALKSGLWTFQFHC